MTNPIDERQRKRQSSEQLVAAKVDAIEHWSPQFVGALQGLTTEISGLRHINERSSLLLERLINTLDRLELTERGLTEELAALRSTRPTNGHDTLEGDQP